jgi:hypothetical protein
VQWVGTDGPQNRVAATAEGEGDMAHSHYYRKTPIVKDGRVEVMIGECKCGKWGPGKYDARYGGNDTVANMLGKLMPSPGLIRKYGK